MELHVSSIVTGQYLQRVPPVSAGRGSYIQIHMHIYVKQDPQDIEARFYLHCTGKTAVSPYKHCLNQEWTQSEFSQHWREALVLAIRQEPQEYTHSLRCLLQPWNTVMPRLFLPNQICVASPICQRDLAFCLLTKAVDCLRMKFSWPVRRKKPCQEKSAKAKESHGNH